MKNIILFLSLIAIGFTACGPSKAEINAKLRLQTIQDSIANAADAAKQDELKQQLITLKAKLEAERTKLGDVEHFKFLRSAKEKAEQIEAQTKIVEELKSQIREIQKQIRR